MRNLSKMHERHADFLRIYTRYSTIAYPTNGHGILHSRSPYQCCLAESPITSPLPSPTHDRSTCISYSIASPHTNDCLSHQSSPLSYQCTRYCIACPTNARQSSHFSLLRSERKPHDSNERSTCKCRHPVPPASNAG